MRIFVVSDTHGNTVDFVNKVNTIGKPELFIHLGDYVEDGEKIEKKTGVETIIVKGNGDYFHPKYKEDEILNIKGKTLLLTHGHNHGVRYGIDRLLYKAEEVGADLALFGHTHLPFFHEEGGVMLFNPGSASIPRGFNRKKTFGIIDIDKMISVEIVNIN